MAESEFWSNFALIIVKKRGLPVSLRPHIEQTATIIQHATFHIASPNTVLGKDCKNPAGGALNNNLPTSIRMSFVAQEG